MSRIHTVIRNLPIVFAVIVVSSSQAQTPRYARGEILARFAAGSEGSAVVARAMQADPTDLRPLVPAITALGARAGVPLEVKSIGSGNWLVMTIDTTALFDRVEQQLGALVNVERADRRAETPRLLLRFTADTPESRATASKLDGTSDELFERLVWSFERDVGLPLVAEVVGRQELALGIDVNALTLSVVARLQALSEVDAAQPNYIQRRM